MYEESEANASQVRRRIVRWGGVTLFAAGMCVVAFVAVVFPTRQTCTACTSAAPVPSPAHGDLLREVVGFRADTVRLARDIESLRDTVDRLTVARDEPDARPVSRAPAAAERAEPLPRTDAAMGTVFHNTFETDVDGWFVARISPDITGELTRTPARGESKVGERALALRYTVESGKLPLIARTTVMIDRLSLWLRTVDQPAAVVVGVGERDDSDYQTVVYIGPGEGWKHFEFDLATFYLSDQSEDENDRLDYHQIRSVFVADLSGFLGGEGENSLLIDEVIGEYRSAGAVESKAVGESIAGQDAF